MMLHLRPSTISRERGFTLIEVLLASFIFASVVTIAVGSFTNQITLQTKTDAQRQVQQTTQAIVEAISRDFRTYSANFQLAGVSCGPTFGNVCGSELVLSPGVNERRYRFSGNTIYLGSNALHDASKVEVTSFRVEGVVPASVIANQRTQPFIVITLSSRTPITGRAEDYADITVRTMISSRLFNKY